MKKLLSSSLLSILCAASLIAGRPDPTTRALLAKETSTIHASRGDDDMEEDKKAPYIPMIVLVENDNAIDTLMQLGSIVWRQRDDMALVSVPRDSLNRATNLSSILYYSSSLQSNTCMDVARPYCGIDHIHTGTNLPHPFDGTGVVVGFTDIGFDHNHIAFADRVKEFHVYDTAYGQYRYADTSESLKEFCTDDSTAFHATHVANILTGAYKGNPYYGIATGAEIVATTSTLDDVGILCGIENIIDYARQEGKPAVINISLSSSIGPHDGTDLLCRYLSACAKEAIICCSSSNYGTKNISAHHVFDTKKPIVSLSLANSKTNTCWEMESISEIWSVDSRPISLRLDVYDLDEKTFVYSSPWVGGIDEPDSLKITPDEFPEFGKYMQGEAILSSEVFGLNNRFCATAYYNITSEEISSRGNWSRYTLAISMKAEEGTEFYAFTSAGSSLFGLVNGNQRIYPSPDFSISDMCTAPGVISVGACSTRNSAPKLESEPFEWSYQIDAAANFSSYGFGLPHFCAPGNHVISAVSNPYWSRNPDKAMSDIAVVDGVNYPYFPECGTSMSAPYAAGSFALWLQACPHLDSSEIIEIASSTARRDFADIDNPRWGAGCIDTYAGLKKVIETYQLDPDFDLPLVRIENGNKLDITIPSGKTPKIILSAPTGICHDYNRPLAPGIYILKIEGYPSYKILIP